MDKFNKNILIAKLVCFCVLAGMLLYAGPALATSYTITGTLTPDATTANTGEPAGTHNDYPYWSWVNGVTTWYLAFNDYWGDGIASEWCIGTGITERDTKWIGDNLIGSYTGVADGVNGTATVAEYVPNTTPSVPTLVSPANAASTNDTTPTLSANYTDPDTADTGTTNYRIATSADNCTAGTTVDAGTSSATADENENTTYTPSSSIGSDGTYYWCAQNNDGTAQSAWTSMGSFTLDTASPTISSVVSSVANLTTASVSWTTSEASSTQLEYGLTNSYGSTTTETNTDTRVTSHSQQASLAPCKTYHMRAVSTDSAGNQATGEDFTVDTACAGSGAGATGSVGFATGVTAAAAPAPAPSAPAETQAPTPSEQSSLASSETSPSSGSPQSLSQSISQMAPQVVQSVTTSLESLAQGLQQLISQLSQTLSQMAQQAASSLMTGFLHMFGR